MASKNNEETLIVLSENWHISLRYGKDIYKNGFDPASCIMNLNGIGTIKNVVALIDEIPDLSEMDPEKCYLGFEIDLDTDEDARTIEEIFNFVKNDCEIKIIPPYSNISQYIKLIQTSKESPELLGNLLVDMGTLSESEFNIIMNKVDRKSGSKFDILEYSNGHHQSEIININEKKVQNISEQNKFLKIKEEKIETLINLVGELVIAGSNVKQLSEGKNDAELNESVSFMTRLIEDIRDNTMNIRMVPVGDGLNKIGPFINELTDNSEKKVELVIDAGDTEMDKVLFDKVFELLKPLVRNSVDHGIENHEIRKNLGKEQKGTIILNAYYDIGSVVIEVGDDGCGIDPEKIFQKAVDLGICSQIDKISDFEILQLIFEEKFYDSNEMDENSRLNHGLVRVKKIIESLRGTIYIESIPKEGTMIRIYLPLSSAIIDGFMVEVGESNFVLPLDMIIECSDVTGQIQHDNDGTRFLNLRGEMFPYIKLREFFEVDGESPDKENVIIVDFAGKKAGLIIDKPVGEIQTVVKPVSKVFKHQKWLSGAAILGNGDVALILDIPRLLNYTNNNVSIKLNN